MTESNGTEMQKWKGGTVLFAGGTDWSSIGRNIAGKKKGAADAADASRAEKYPNLVSPRQLKALVDVRIAFIAAGSAACHCLAGGMDGKLYTWGRNEKGQLGHGDLLQRNVPTVVEGLSKHEVIGGAGGRHHTVVVTKDGASFAFGSNKEGQCGTGSIKSNPKSEELLKAPVEVQKISDCTAVACGAEFSIWLCDGKMWSAGGSQYGQLGHGTDHEYNAKDSSVKIMYEPQPTPRKISALSEKVIRAFACGHNHTLALDTEQAAYTWGNGGYGRLGHSVQKDEFTPKQVDALKGRMPVDKDSPAACGATSSFCTMIGEQLVSWGKLKASGDNTMYPKVVHDLAGWKVRTIACGAGTYALAAGVPGDADNSTVTWGQAMYGELAYGEKGKKSSANPDKCQALEGIYTHQVALGIGHSMFLVDPDSEKVKDFEVFEPEEAVSEATNPEAAEGTKGAAGKGKGTKRKADAPAAKKGKGKK
ncbi:hypothetical protein CVIRNUC_001046 [Coccomyxa viridis]|uniref:Uncharacterized protein n=1 Tax=Coccomyxa viridis TaxID=1274662 RepID=A0AAV1HSW7_9CHLO|nr:hypothetical protein CVIRNUC_001046 [Coccomyxa viridis]